MTEDEGGFEQGLVPYSEENIRFSSAAAVLYWQDDRLYVCDSKCDLRPAGEASC